MVACVLSKDNIAKRSEGFFSTLCDEFVRLATAIETRGAVVGAGIRIELCGDLDILRIYGGSRSALADAIEAVVAKTTHIVSPRLRLFFGVGYGDDIPCELGVDVILRTGMEEEGVFRSSGLSPREGTICIASTKLWPHIEPADVDAALEAAARCHTREFAAGHPPSFIAEVIAELSRAEFDVPVCAVFPTDAPRQSIIAALEGHCPRGSEHFGAVAVAVHGAAGRTGALQWYRRPTGMRHEVHVIPANLTPSTAQIFQCDAFLLPGQSAPALVLPGGSFFGYANVHACGTGAYDIVLSMRAATRFLLSHPPLRGAERGPSASGTYEACHKVVPASLADGSCIGPDIAQAQGGRSS